MRIEELNNKKVAIVGFGKEGHSTLVALQRFAPAAAVTVLDQYPINEPGVVSLSGSDYLQSLGDFEVIVKSPGVVMGPELQKVRERVTSSTQIFLDTVKAKGSTVVGVTGSKGKSTTASLIYAILKKGGLSVQLVGNIGSPVLDHLDEAGKTLFVVEMSSFQLAECTTSPQVAVIVSFFPEHLDHHHSLQEYWEAKANVVRFQGSRDLVIFNKGFAECESMAQLSRGKKVGVTAEDCPYGEDQMHLKGRHNLANCALACQVAVHFKVPQEKVAAAVQKFKPLPHRLESVGVKGGITWVDDAISTTPESTIAALDTLGEVVDVLILGGTDRGYDFTKLANRILAAGISKVILFPESGKRIRSEIEKLSKSMSFYEAHTMEEAVKWAFKHTAPGKTCLLSTASPSYTLFKNFEDKGEQFAYWIKKGAV